MGLKQKIARYFEKKYELDAYEADWVHPKLKANEKVRSYLDNPPEGWREWADMFSRFFQNAKLYLMVMPGLFMDDEANAKLHLKRSCHQCPVWRRSTRDPFGIGNCPWAYEWLNKRYDIERDFGAGNFVTSFGGHADVHALDKFFPKCRVPKDTLIFIGQGKKAPAKLNGILSRSMRFWKIVLSRHIPFYNYKDQ